MNRSSAPLWPLTGGYPKIREAAALYPRALSSGDFFWITVIFGTATPDLGGENARIFDF
jgi:hypothetical protein